jgi:hypothetical protein
MARSCFQSFSGMLLIWFFPNWTLPFRSSTVNRADSAHLHLQHYHAAKPESQSTRSAGSRPWPLGVIDCFPTSISANRSGTRFEVSERSVQRCRRLPMTRCEGF